MTAGTTINDLVHQVVRGMAPGARAPGVKTWTCDLCAAAGTWTDGWKWYGRLEDAQGSGPVVEAVHCPACPPGQVRA